MGLDSNVVLGFLRPDGSRGAISVKELIGMDPQEFLVFKDRLVNVRDTVKYDMAIFEKVASITPQHKMEIFRKGEGQSEKYATSDTTYNKTLFNTNIPRDGQVPAGGLWIIYDIAAPIRFVAGTPTTQAANGAITNAKVSAFSAYNDFALALDAWVNQTQLKYTEGSSEDAVVKGLIKDFPANSGQVGFAGSSVGGIAQNAMIPNVALRTPRVLEGGEEFAVEIAPLADFDTSSGSGINQMIVQKVELKVIELIRQPA